MAFRIIRRDQHGRSVTQRIQAQCIAGRELIFAAHAMIRAHRLPGLAGLIHRFEVERSLLTAVVLVPDDVPDVDAWAIGLREEMRRMVIELEWEWRRRGLPWPPEEA